MRTPWWCVFAALSLLAACEEEAEAAEPEAIAPLEVTSDDDEPGTRTAAAEGETDVDALEARVAELERQLADRQQTPAATEAAGGTHVATVPDGVDVPDQDEAAPTGSSTASSTADGAEHPSSRRTGSARQRESSGPATRAPDLLGVLLGDNQREPRPRARDERDEGERDERSPARGGSLNPVDILGL